MKTENDIFLVTDKRNLPQSKTFYGIIHTLMYEYAAKFSSQPFFVPVTPEKALTMKTPSAVIDRTLAYNDNIRRCHDKWTEQNVPYVNHPDLMFLLADKMATYDLLYKLGVAHPRSVKISDYPDLVDFITTQGVGNRTVVKPVYGSEGTLVFFVDLITPDQVMLYWREGVESQAMDHNLTCSLQSFYYDILCQKTTTEGRTNNYMPIAWLIQEYCQLIDVNGLATDFRVIEQRDNLGSLCVQKIHGRQSVSRTVPLTNLSKGGNLCPVDNLLIQAGMSIEGLVRFCRQIDDILENTTGTKIGEIGHDIAIVKTCHGYQFVYLEGNTMPGYPFSNWIDLRTQPQPVQLSSLSQSDRPLITNPVDYSRYIACP